MISKDGVEYVKAFNASLIIILNLLKLLFCKKLCLRKLDPYTMFMINFALTGIVLGCMLLIGACSELTNNSTVGNNQYLVCMNILANCGVFASCSIYFIHINVYELFKTQIVLKPFLRHTVTKTMVFRFIFASWFLALLFAVPLHVCLTSNVSKTMIIKYEHLLLSIFALMTIPTIIFCVAVISNVLRRRRTSVGQLVEGKVSKILVGGPKRNTKTGIASLVIFSVSWLPFVVCSTIEVIADEEGSHSDAMRYLHTIAYLLNDFYWVWSPIVYIVSVLIERRRMRSLERLGKLRSSTRTETIM